MTLIGAVHLGAVVACLVVLIPVVKAGWPLRRNKIFFALVFSICVHPSVSLQRFNATHNVSSSIDLYDKRWDWSKSHKLNTYDFQKLSKSDASDLLNGSWVVVAGDSQARCFALSLLNLILGPQAQRMYSVIIDLFKRQSDYNIFIDEIGVTLAFI
ncbi:uncharacterized protein LOC120184397 [Hibiscus syriacus]|uniref:uncharacterized protein LOC120184397 n=1 Tax=Hibiscus syriacus TaxID=106335 RepID=UPI0019211FDB|nr:uncharacterized protein LOC120184397 [Hibiscus syriacus]